MAAREVIDYENLSDNELIELLNTHTNYRVRDEARSIAIMRRQKQVDDAAYRHLKWANSCDLEDLKQEAWRGVLKALENYDASFGVPFHKYAFRWCDAYVRYAIYSKGRVIKTPIPVIRSIARIKKAKIKLKDELGREPSLVEIGKETRLSVKRIIKYMQADATIFSISKTTSDDDDSGEFELPAHSNLDPAQFAIIVEAREIRDRILEEVLNDRDRYIIKHRCSFDNFEKKTLQDLADELDMTRMGVLQSQRRSLKKIVDSYESYAETGEF